MWTAFLCRFVHYSAGSVAQEMRLQWFGCYTVVLVTKINDSYRLFAADKFDPINLFRCARRRGEL